MTTRMPCMCHLFSSKSGTEHTFARTLYPGPVRYHAGAEYYACNTQGGLTDGLRCNHGLSFQPSHISSASQTHALRPQNPHPLSTSGDIIVASSLVWHHQRALPLSMFILDEQLTTILHPPQKEQVVGPKNYWASHSSRWWNSSTDD